MTGTTISNSYVNGVTLANAAVYNPVTILAGAAITNAAGPAVYGTGTIDWTISNAGRVQATQTAAHSYDITREDGGAGLYRAGVTVSGVYEGLAITTIGTVVNQGSIAAIHP